MFPYFARTRKYHVSADWVWLWLWLMLLRYYAYRFVGGYMRHSPLTSIRGVTGGCPPESGTFVRIYFQALSVRSGAFASLACFSGVHARGSVLFWVGVVEGVRPDG